MSVETSNVSIVEQKLAIKRTGPLDFVGLSPLTKPSPSSRGVYGGNLCAQAIVVALETVGQDFVPHSLHSYFIAAGDDSKPCSYKVEELSNGKNFANRLVRLSQDNELKYIIMISLTKRNSLKNTAAAFEKTGKGPRPFEYQAPPDQIFFKYKPEELPSHHSNNKKKLVTHKVPPEFIEAHETETSKSAGERGLSFFIKINDNTEMTKNFKYGSMGIISDSLFLTTVSRILHLPEPEEKPVTGANPYFFSVSLDHSIYFHDDDFDPTKWLYFTFKSPRFANNRVLFNGSYYNDKGKLVATMVQEGLVFFKNDIDLKAKL